jgi:hypothetical protein
MTDEYGRQVSIMYGRQVSIVALTIAAARGS